MDKRLVAHDDCADELERGDLQGKIKGSYESHGSVGPPHARTHLTCVVARYSKAPRREPHLQNRHMDADYARKLDVAAPTS